MLLTLLATVVFQSQFEVKQLPDPAIAALSEQSGLIKSGRFPGVFWANNDSGDSARIFAFTADGQPVNAPKNKPYEGVAIEGAANFDWEDLASDGDNLYVSDLGNNANARRDLAIYVVPEPNPYEVKRSFYLKRIPVKYDDQIEFPPKADYHWDCEAIFSWRGQLYAITKHRVGKTLPGTSANLYELGSTLPNQFNVFKKRGTATGLPGWVTAADVSPDGTKLAVLCDRPKKAVLVIDLNKPSRDWLAKPLTTIDLPMAWGQTESIAWDNNRTLWVGHETGDN